MATGSNFLSLPRDLRQLLALLALLLGLGEFADAFFISFWEGAAVFSVLFLAATLWSRRGGSAGRSWSARSACSSCRASRLGTGTALAIGSARSPSSSLRPPDYSSRWSCSSSPSASAGRRRARHELRPCLACSGWFRPALRWRTRVDAIVRAATVPEAANEVFHLTFFTAPGADEFWMTGTDEGTATITPDTPGGGSASGHFISWFGESSNNQNDVQHSTNTFNLTGSDGTHVVMHETFHLSTSATGVTVGFDKSTMTLSCG